MKQENDIYKKIIDEKGLAGLLVESEKIESSSLKSKENEEDNLEEEVKKYADGWSKLFCFFDFLQTKPSFFRAYKDLKQINCFFKSNPNEIKNLKRASEKNGFEIENITYNQVLKYLNSFSEGSEKRVFDIGDKVRVNCLPNSYGNKNFRAYVQERNQIFPRRSIGTVVWEKYFNTSRGLGVYFKSKSEYEPQIEKFDETVVAWFNYADYGKNIGCYSSQELIFIPPNKMEYFMMRNEANKLKELLKQ